jgi:hypothetical protein
MMLASVVERNQRFEGKRVFRLRDCNGDDLKCYGCGKSHPSPLMKSL